MKPEEKSIILFLLFCIPLRLFLVYLARYFSKSEGGLEKLKKISLIALIPAIAFAYLYFTNGRKTGAETFGKPIWWNDLRIIHSLLFLLFVIYAYNKNKYAWMVLLADVLVGLTGFYMHHFVK